MGSPRVDVVFLLWQCDKENHGWREGPPLTVPAKVPIRGRAFTLRQSQFRTKKEYCFAEAGASPLLRTLAGIKRLVGCLLVRWGFISRYRVDGVATLPLTPFGALTGRCPTCQLASKRITSAPPTAHNH
jgi:hypothetical protein